MDDLQECAFAFSRLFDFRYRIIIGRKQIQREIILQFSPSEFHHLIGLHYLKDLDYFMKTDKNTIFSDILEGRKCLKDVHKSFYYESIADRIREFSKIISDLFDVSKIVFKYVNPVYLGSNLQAEYLIKCVSHTGTISFLFLDKDEENQETHFCRSFFVYSIRDYSKNQSSFIVIYIEKTNLQTQEVEIILNKMK